MKVPVKVIQVLMGHSDFKTTMNVYAEIMAESMADLLQEVNWDADLFPRTGKAIMEQDSDAFLMMDV